MTTEKTTAQQFAAQAREVDAAKAAAQVRATDQENARITGTYNQQVADFIIGRRQAGELIVEGWDDLVKQPWQMGAYVVYKHGDEFFWVGQAVKIGSSAVAQTAVTSSYEHGGYLIVGKAAHQMWRLTDLSVFKYRAEYDDKQAKILADRQSQADQVEAEHQAWLKSKHRDFAPVRIVGGGTANQNASLSVLRERMKHFGITATRNTSSDRVLVSRPKGGGTNHILSAKWFDLALQYAEFIDGKQGRCDVPKCQRKADYPTDSGAVICGTHAGRSSD